MVTPIDSTHDESFLQKCCSCFGFFRGRKVKVEAKKIKPNFGEWARARPIRVDPKTGVMHVARNGGGGVEWVPIAEDD
jgi:hypothetical protein